MRYFWKKGVPLLHLIFLNVKCTEGGLKGLKVLKGLFENGTISVGSHKKDLKKGFLSICHPSIARGTKYPLDICSACSL